MANQPPTSAIPYMNNPRWFLSLFLNALLLNTLASFCLHQNAIADTRFSTFNNNFNNHSPVYFSLSFSRIDLDLKSNNILYPIRESRVSAKLFNRVSTGLNIGLILGSNFLSQDDDATTAGLSLNGNHIGFAVNGTFGSELQLGLHASYVYQQAKGENTLRTASLTWHEWLTEVTLRLSLGAHWAIIASGGLMGIDVDRRISGDINETIRMKLADDFQGNVAIEMLTAPADRIRLTLNRGALEGFELAFAHAF